MPRRPFVCRECWEKFRNEKALRLHMFDNHSNRYSCTRCWFRTHNKVKMSRHHVKHGVLVANHCTKCPYRTTDVTKLGKHVRRWHGLRNPFRCCNCKQNTDRNLNYKHSRLGNLGTGTDVGLELFYAEERERGLYKRRRHDDLIKYRYLRLSWSRFEGSLDFLDTEKVLLSQAETQYDLLRQLYTCKKCKFRSYSKRVHTGHLRHHRPDKLYECPVCEFGCWSRSFLADHIKSDHPPTKKYPCRFCSYDAKGDLQLTMHIKEEHYGRRRRHRSPIDHPYPILLSGRNLNYIRRPYKVYYSFLRKKWMQVKPDTLALFCCKCYFYTYDAPELNYHIHRAHPSKKLHCNQCNFHTRSIPEMRRHHRRRFKTGYGKLQRIFSLKLLTARKKKRAACIAAEIGRHAWKKACRAETQRLLRAWAPFCRAAMDDLYGRAENNDPHLAALDREQVPRFSFYHIRHMSTRRHVPKLDTEAGPYHNLNRPLPKGSYHNLNNPEPTVFPRPFRRRRRRLRAHNQTPRYGGGARRLSCRPNGRPQYFCQECGLDFNQRGHLLRHLWEHDWLDPPSDYRPDDDEKGDDEKRDDEESDNDDLAESSLQGSVKAFPLQDIDEGQEVNAYEITPIKKDRDDEFPPLQKIDNLPHQSKDAILTLIPNKWLNKPILPKKADDILHQQKKAVEIPPCQDADEHVKRSSQIFERTDEILKKSEELFKKADGILDRADETIKRADYLLARAGNLFQQAPEQVDLPPPEEGGRSMNQTNSARPSQNEDANLQISSKNTPEAAKLPKKVKTPDKPPRIQEKAVKTRKTATTQVKRAKIREKVKTPEKTVKTADKTIKTAEKEDKTAEKEDKTAEKEVKTAEKEVKTAEKSVKIKEKVKIQEKVKPSVKEVKTSEKAVKKPDKVKTSEKEVKTPEKAVKLKEKVKTPEKRVKSPKKAGIKPKRATPPPEKAGKAPMETDQPQAGPSSTPEKADELTQTEPNASPAERKTRKAIRKLEKSILGAQNSVQEACQTIEETQCTLVLTQGKLGEALNHIQKAQTGLAKLKRISHQLE